MAQSIDKLKSIEQTPDTLELFGKLFEAAGIRISDSREEFSCYHQGTYIEFKEVLDEASVDYVIELTTTQVNNLLELMSTKHIDDIRRYRILSTLFTPAIDAAVNPFHCLHHNILEQN